MTQHQLDVLNNVLPLLIGFFFAVVELQRKYPTMFKYSFRPWSTWAYIVVSMLGSWVFTRFVEAIGMRIINEPIINTIILGLIGPGIFLGILPNIPYKGSSAAGDAEKSLKTIRDHIYKVLDDATLLKTTQFVQRKIKSAGEEMDPNSFLTQAKNILMGKLSSTEAAKTVKKYDREVAAGFYAGMIRELLKYNEPDYIISSFNDQSNRDRLHSKLYQSIQLALESHFYKSIPSKLRKEIPVEFIIAKILALQKNPDQSLYYLELSFRKKRSLKNDIIMNNADWWILTSMTDGTQVEELERFMKLLDRQLPSLEELRKHCALLQSINPDVSFSFKAVKKSDGNCIRVTLKKSQAGQNNQIKWHIIGDGDAYPNRECINFDEVVQHIDDVVILTLLDTSQNLP